MAEETLTGNPIITTATDCAWITKNKAVKINSIIWRELATSTITLALTDGVSTATAHLYILRSMDSGVKTSVIDILPEPIVVSNLKIEANKGSTDCAGGTLEIWFD